MKKFLSIFIVCALIFSVVSFAATDVSEILLTINSPAMLVDGVEFEVDPGRGTCPVIIDGRTLVPVRAVVEAIGGTVGWDDASRTAILAYNGTEIKLTIDSVVAVVDGVRTTLDARPCVINERTHLPIRFVMETFGYAVLWDDATKCITITKKENVEPEFDRPINKVTAKAVLSDNEIQITGKGMVAEASVLTITQAGVYEISGTLTDGQIIIDAPDTDDVELLLCGVNITSNVNSPIYCKNANNFYVSLKEGTENVLTDAKEYTYADEAEEEPNAALFSKVDLNIGGKGALLINANFNNGIGTKDDLVFEGGTYKINAVDDAVRGRDSVTISAGTFDIVAGGDGISSNNPNGPSDGWITISHGTINITATGDAIQAESSLGITNGTLNIKTEGTPKGTSDSQKALKAGTRLTIIGGTINIDSIDDAFNANDAVTISGGKIFAKTENEAIQSDVNVTITGGTTEFVLCSDGIKTPAFEMTDGSVTICATDDVISIQSEEPGAVKVTGGVLSGVGAADEPKLYEDENSHSLSVTFDAPVTSGTEISVLDGEEVIFSITPEIDVNFVQITGGIAEGTEYTVKTQTQEYLASAQ